MDATGKLYSSTAIVTVNFEGKLNGISVAWITRVSIDPPMIAISIGKTRYSHSLLEGVEMFGVCIMGSDALKIVTHFGGKSGRDFNKFDGIEYRLSNNSIPILEDSIAYLECRIAGKADAGDHTLFIGEVIKDEVYSDALPLLHGEHRIL